MSKWREYIPPAVIVGGAGYFVDIFDLFLFVVHRIASISEITRGEDSVSHAVGLLNTQMVALIIGGFFWGVLSDKIGRKKTLYGSILLYSLATLCNGLITSIPQYYICRALAGFGLAGELGIAVTLVTESMKPGKRGHGVYIMAGFGLCGGLFAGLTEHFLTWRQSFFLGGALGILILILRIRVDESVVFLKYIEQNQKQARKSSITVVQRFYNSFIRLHKEDVRLLFLVTLIGMPIYYISSVFIFFAPELAREIGVTDPISAGQAITYSYAGTVSGDFFFGFLSQKLKSRFVPVKIGLLLAGSSSLFVLLYPISSAPVYTFMCLFVGFCAGYWVVLLTAIAEVTATGRRGTVTTTAPNLVRATTIPLTLTWAALQNVWDKKTGAIFLALIVFPIAWWAINRMDDPFEREL
ncbi:MAG: MFS transporter [Bdellovibrionales bacterium CG10_big_fil_rev_8_21_14_0_10_45_34]|nr:MAG: MFS transporter [Bdellovibrionales bacterium CG10_big_fil_rev_8_21_14_0_10_45_34]